MEDKDRKEFLKNIEGSKKDTLIGKNIKTDFEAIERAKRILNK